MSFGCMCETAEPPCLIYTPPRGIRRGELRLVCETCGHERDCHSRKPLREDEQ
jgi:hypothetical protein